jgi:hypothetical protein
LRDFPASATKVICESPAFTINENVSKHFSRPVDIRLSQADRPAQDICNFAITEVLEIPENEDDTEFLGNMILQIVADAPLQFGFDDDSLRRIFIREDLDLDLYLFEIDSFTTMVSFVAPASSAKKVNGNLAQPSAKARFRTEIGELPVSY